MPKKIICVDVDNRNWDDDSDVISEEEKEF